MSNFFELFELQDPQSKFLVYCDKWEQNSSSGSKDPELKPSIEALFREMEVHMRGNYPYTISALQHYDVIIRLQRNGVWSGDSVFISTGISEKEQMNLYEKGLALKHHFVVEMPTCMLPGGNADLDPVTPLPTSPLSATDFSASSLIGPGRSLSGINVSASKLCASSLSASTLSHSGFAASDLTTSRFTASKGKVRGLRISSAGITMSDVTASNVTISDLAVSNLTVSNATVSDPVVLGLNVSGLVSE